MPARRERLIATLLLLGSMLGLALLSLRLGNAHSRLVVYCAHDAIFADEVLQDFTRETGIALDVRYDTEATKSLGLVRLIVREAKTPRCDVFWNNELLGTEQLRQAELLVPYFGTGWQRMLAPHRADDGGWVGFAARLRVQVSHGAQMLDEAAVQQHWNGPAPRSVVYATPLFGTTLTHFTVLAKAWGMSRLQAWRREQLQHGMREVPGNAVAMQRVAQGDRQLGWTDSDDAFSALDRQAEITMAPVLVDGRPLCIPNTAAIVRGTQRLAAAQRLIDYLASESVELKLARSPSRQIPLGPTRDENLSAEVRQLRDWSQGAWPLANLLPERQAVVDWLQAELAP